MPASIKPNEKEVARVLCRDDGFAEDGFHEVVEGFTVPGWVLYVGLARRLLNDREALKAANRSQTCR